MRTFIAGTLSLVSALFVFATAGCGGNQPYDPSVGGTVGNDWQFEEATNPVFTIGFGGSTVITLQQIGSGTSRPVTLSLSPPPNGSSASLTSSSVTPTLSGAGTTLNINVPIPSILHKASTRGESNIGGQITVTGTDGVHTHSITITFTAEPGPSWSFTVPQEIDVNQGSSNTGVATLTLNGPPIVAGQVRMVQVTANGNLDPTMSVQLTPSQVLPSTSGTAFNITVTATNSTPTNDYELTLAGSDGVLSNSSQTFDVTVNGGGILHKPQVTIKPKR